MSNQFQISGTANFQAPTNSQTVNESLNLTTQINPTGAAFIKSIGSLTNTSTQQVLTGVTTPGTIILRNLDGTNTVTYGPNNTSVVGSLAPGALNIWSPNGTALYANTTSGTASLQIFAIST